jgi:predicted metal-dependent phosphoesterase TrpH
VFIIDLHNHAEFSKNTDLSILDYTKEALRLNVSVAITEHNCIYKHAGIINNVLVFPGMEILNDYGDFIVFGAPEDCLKRRDIFELIDYIHKCGGIIIAAHPFSGYGVCKVLDGELSNKIIRCVDAVEVLNGLANKDDCKKAKQIAAIYNKPCTGGSDAHHKKDLFQVGTMFFNKVENIYDLICAVKSGRCKPTFIKRVLELQE